MLSGQGSGFNRIHFLQDALGNNLCLNFPSRKRHTAIPKHVWFSWWQSISWRWRLNKFSSLQFHRDVTGPMVSQQGQHNWCMMGPSLTLVRDCTISICQACLEEVSSPLCLCKTLPKLHWSLSLSLKLDKSWILLKQSKPNNYLHWKDKSNPARYEMTYNVYHTRTPCLPLYFLLIIWLMGLAALFILIPSQLQKKS